jgi:hypothetical protein
MQLENTGTENKIKISIEFQLLNANEMANLHAIPLHREQIDVL